MPALAKTRPLNWQRFEGADFSRVSAPVSGTEDTFAPVSSVITSLARVRQPAALDLVLGWMESLWLLGQNIGALRVPRTGCSGSGN